jgi:hypothetical protein
MIDGLIADALMIDYGLNQKASACELQAEAFWLVFSVSFIVFSGWLLVVGC